MSRHQSEPTAVEHPQADTGARRRQVLQWLVEGLDMPTIARRIHRKPQVVQRHVDELLKRLGATTPTEALEKLANADVEVDGDADATEATEASAVDAAEPAAAA